MVDSVSSTASQGVVSTQMAQVQNDTSTTAPAQQTPPPPPPPPADSGRGDSVDTSA